MKKITTTLAAVSFVLVAACTKKNDTPVASSGPSTEQILDSTFKQMDSSYSAKNTVLANMIDGVKSEIVWVGNGSYETVPSIQVEFYLKHLEHSFKSEPVAITEAMKKGKVFDVNIIDYEKIRNEIKGRLSAAARCFDDCNRIALLFRYTATDGIADESDRGLLAGYVLIKGEEKGADYHIQHSVGNTTEFGIQKELRSRWSALNRTEEEKEAQGDYTELSKLSVEQQKILNQALDHSEEDKKQSDDQSPARAP